MVGPEAVTSRRVLPVPPDRTRHRLQHEPRGQCRDNAPLDSSSPRAQRHGQRSSSTSRCSTMANAVSPRWNPFSGGIRTVRRTLDSVSTSRRNTSSLHAVRHRHTIASRVVNSWRVESGISNLLSPGQTRRPGPDAEIERLVNIPHEVNTNATSQYTECLITPPDC